MPKQSEEHIEIWDKYISLYREKLKDYSPKIYKTDHCAVIVEPREHKDLEIICKNVMYYLNESGSDIKWGLKIYYGNKNKEFVKKFTQTWNNIQLENLEIDDLSGILYNNMLKTTKFWETIPTENVLIFQTDTILRRFGIDEFTSYNYVGAPWIRYREGKIVGNGGLSFRKKSRMLEIIRDFQDDTIDMEDIYFCKYLKNEDIAPYDVAKKFSVEDVYYQNPLGLHQPKVDLDNLDFLLKINLNKEIKFEYRTAPKSGIARFSEMELDDFIKFIEPYENNIIIFDDTFEPFSFYHTEEDIDKLNNFLNKNNILIKYLCTGWTPTDTGWGIYGATLFKNTNIQVIHYPFAMAYYWKTWLEEIFQSNIEDINFDYKFNKLFYTLIRNPKYHRCLLLDKLCQNDLLKDGEYSFLIKSWEGGVDYNFKCFSPVSKIIDKDEKRNSSLKEVITPFLSEVDGFVNIVTETFYHQFQPLYFSEKTFYPILYKRPFLVLSTDGFYKKFVDCGFKLYDEVFDYSFDGEENIKTRCNLIIENIKRLRGKDLNELYKILYKKIEFNKKHLLNIIKENKIII